jgi:hypothetical protein
MRINNSLKAVDLAPKIGDLWSLSAGKIRSIRDQYSKEAGTPVLTRGGRYTTQGWTEWTQGFQFGSAILQFDAENEQEFLEYGREQTLDLMAPHLTHTGVHDHGFNNLSTYGNLRRLMLEGRIPYNPWEKDYYSLALRISASVQALRWTKIKEGGFIYSFNGPHSLFVDTLRSCRVLAVGYQLGHILQAENDARISLLGRLIAHAGATAKYSVFYGEGRDAYDVRGRTAHECIFNVNDGNYRCVNTQQGYSGFSTWTRGLAWAMLGFSELLEFIETVSETELQAWGGKAQIEETWLKAARATCDFYIQHTPLDGIPYWDTGAPGLVHLGDYLERDSDPFNAHEPVDSSAAAIAAQGLMRLGTYLKTNGQDEAGQDYFQAGLTVSSHLFDDPYLSRKNDHQGLILHSIYHRPNAWDHIPQGSSIPMGESSMWGDYHARELALYLQRIIRNENYYSFYLKDTTHE